MSKEEEVKGSPIIRDKKTGDPLWVDVRELTLKYILPVAHIEKFFEALKEGKLLATKCRRCGARCFPPQADCPDCGSSDVEWFEVNGAGRLLTYTVINVKPESYSDYPDYVVGVARLAEGFNVLAWVECDDPKKLRRGMPVKIKARKRKEGFFSYHIVPVEE